MKKIIEDPKKKKKSKMNSILKKIMKKYKDKPEEQNIILPSILDAIQKKPEEIGIEPLTIGDEREYLRALLSENDYNILKIQLNYFSEIFPIRDQLAKDVECPKCSGKMINLIQIGSKVKCLCGNEFIVEKPKLKGRGKDMDSDLSYKEAIKNILNKYNNIRTVKYILRLFLNQYSLTLKDFNDKFLRDPIKFNELKQLRKLFLRIIKNANFETKNLDDNLDEPLNTLENNLESIHSQLIEFKEKHSRYNDQIKMIYESLGDTSGKILLSFTQTPEVGKKEEKVILSPLSSIITDFDLNLTLKFMKQFLDQSHQDLNEFYEEFMRDDLVKYRINKYKGVTYLPPEKHATIPKYTIDDKININVNMENCISMYSMLPWIPDKIKGIYICKVDTDITNYIVKIGIPLNIEGEDWYRVNKKYYILQCDNNYYKKQTGNVLNFFNKKTNELFINFKICYQVDTGSKKNKINVILQDEELFIRETEYIRKKNKTPQQKINEMLESPTDSIAIESAFKTLERLFIIVRNNNQESIATNKYIKDVINEINSQTNTLGEFIKKLGELAVYLSPYLEPVTFGLFKTNIEFNLYTPKELLNLTQKEKLPEVFGDNFMFEGDKNKIINTINDELTSSLNEFGQDFVDNLYIMSNPYTDFKPRNARRYGERFKYNFADKLKDWRKECENFDKSKYDLNKIDKNTLGLYISYMDNGKKYCLNIKDLIKSFRKNDYTNPFTGNIFTNEFITIVKNYDKDEVEKVQINVNIPIVSNVEGSLAPGLLDFIRADIIRMSEIENENNDSGHQDQDTYDDENFILDGINDLESLNSGDSETQSQINILEEYSPLRENIFLEELKSFDEQQIQDGSLHNHHHHNHNNLHSKILHDHGIQDDYGKQDIEIDNGKQDETDTEDDTDTEDEDSGKHEDNTDTEDDTDTEDEDSGKNEDDTDTEDEDSGKNEDDTDTEDEDSGKNEDDTDTEDEDSGKHEDDTDTEDEDSGKYEDENEKQDFGQEYHDILKEDIFKDNQEEIEIPQNSLSKNEYLNLIDDSKYAFELDNGVNKCKKCNAVLDNGYKSLQFDNGKNKAEHIQFCTLKCMEDYEWPKYKKKRKNKKNDN